MQWKTSTHKTSIKIIFFLFDSISIKIVVFLGSRQSVARKTEMDTYRPTSTACVACTKFHKSRKCIVESMRTNDTKKSFCHPKFDPMETEHRKSSTESGNFHLQWNWLKTCAQITNCNHTKAPTLLDYNYYIFFCCVSQEIACFRLWHAVGIVRSANGKVRNRKMQTKKNGLHD